jgi:spermidine/putrescine-binding protein
MTTRIDIAKGTKRAKEAMQYINMALDPLPQLCQAYEVPYGPTNQTLATVMKTYPKLSEQFPSSVEDLKHLYLPDWNAINEQYPNWLEAWNRNVVR